MPGSRWLIAVVACMVWLKIPPVLAMEVPFAGSCYRPLGGVTTPVDRVLFVAVDETVGFDESFSAKIQELIDAWMKPGDAIEVIRFSAGVRQRYAEVVTGGRLDPVPDKELLAKIPIRIKKRFVSCLNGNRRHPSQQAYARMAVRAALKKVFEDADRHIGHSDIIYNIRMLAAHVRAFDAKQKTVLIVSDMLENSSVTSFYRHGRVRRIDPAREMKRVLDSGMVADFGEATKVYVLGLGYFWAGDSGNRERYLDPVRADGIVRFWKKYFEASHAMVGEIGKPMMYGKIH